MNDLRTGRKTRFRGPAGKRRLAAAVACLLFLTPAWAQQSTEEPAAAPPEEEPSIQFDFRDAELRTMVEFMASIEDLIVIMDEEIQGTASISVPRLLTLAEAYQVLSAILDLRDFTLIRGDGLLRVVAKPDSLQKPIPIFYGSDPALIPVEDTVITQIMPVVNTEARQVLDSVRPLVSPTGNVFVNEETNVLVLTDSASNIRRLARMVGFLDVRRPAVTQAQTYVYPIRYMKAADMATALEGVFASSSADTGPGVQITPVESTNGLVISADMDTQSRIEATINALDIRRRQVLIEARIVEASLTDRTSTGVNLVDLLVDTAKGLHNISFGGLASDPSPFVSWSINSQELDLLLTAASQDDNIRILSAPRVVTSDNAEAKILVAQEEPILKSVTDLSSGSTVPRTVSDFIFRDVGIELTVTPRINVDSDVALDVAFSISSLLGNVELPGGTFAPRIGKREGSTTVTVMDGNTLVIGGLIKQDKRDQRNRVPVLGHIPLIGRVFSTVREVMERTELLVFITPYVAASPEEGVEITQQELDRMGEEFREALKQGTKGEQRDGER